MKSFFIRLIRFYQRHISAHMPAQCRYYPTCSAYAIDAIEYYGIVRGGLMALWRILRCNPLSRGGYDPVPLPRGFREASANVNGSDKTREEQ